MFDVQGGGGSFRNRYSAGPALCPMAAAEPTPKTARGGVQQTAPVRIRSGSPSTKSILHRSNGTRRRDPRDGDRYICKRCQHSWPARFGTTCLKCGHDTEQLPPRDEPEGRTLNQKRGAGLKARYTCSACGRTWPQKDGETCHGCRGRAIEAIERDVAAQERIDRKQAARLQAEIDNRPVKCTRCGYDRAKRSDLADIGRCSHCISLTDAEAADLLKRGKALRKRMVQAWKDRDHVRGKAIAEQATALYACCTG